MSLTHEEIGSLLHLLNLTQEEEIDCDQCMALIAEFAERKLSLKTIPEELKAVEQHLALCPECREGYEALQRVLKSWTD